MLEQMGCILTKINGRKVDFSNRFLFQNVDVDTDIIQFDDTDEKFDFSGLYSILTNGLTIEKKNRTAENTVRIIFILPCVFYWFSV